MKLEQTKKEKWAAILKAFKTAGLSMNKYCEANEINRYQFIYWKRKLDPKISEPISEVPAFIKVIERPTVDFECRPLSLVINGFTINVPVNFNEAHLKKLINVVQAID